MDGSGSSIDMNIHINNNNNKNNNNNNYGTEFAGTNAPMDFDVPMGGINPTAPSDQNGQSYTFLLFQPSPLHNNTPDIHSHWHHQRSSAYSYYTSVSYQGLNVHQPGSYPGFNVHNPGSYQGFNNVNQPGLYQGLNVHQPGSYQGLNVHQPHPGLYQGLNVHQPTSRGLNFMYGPEEMIPYIPSHVSPAGSSGYWPGSQPSEMPVWNANPNETLVNIEPVTIMEDLVPYSSSQLAPFDCGDYGYSSNSHFHAPAGSSSGPGSSSTAAASDGNTSDSEEAGSDSEEVEEITYSGRPIRASRVQLTPVVPSRFLSESERAVPVSPVARASSPAHEDWQVPVYTQGVGVNATEGTGDGGEEEAGEHPILTNAYMSLLNSIEIAFANMQRNLRYGGPRQPSNPNDEMYYEMQDWPYEAMMALDDVSHVSIGLTETEISDVLRQQEHEPPSLDADTPCSICLDEYEEGEQVGVLDCDHEFHFECIKGWLIRHNSCPLCRTTF